MQRFNWTPSMSVGQQALDSDHRCLVRIINLLDSAEGEDAERVVQIVLDTLAVYCRYHFSREEEMMRKAGFPGFEPHREEHVSFSSYVEQLRSRLTSGQIEANEVEAASLLDYLINWLRHHILIQDMAYKPYVAGETTDHHGGCPFERQNVCHSMAD